MAQHAQLRIDTGLAVYFCDPQSPWSAHERKHQRLVETEALTSANMLTISPPSRPLLTAAPARPSGKPRRKPWKIAEPDLHLALKCSTAPVSTAFNDLRSLLTPPELERSRTPSVWTPSPSPIYCPVDRGRKKPPSTCDVPGQYLSATRIGRPYDNALAETVSDS